jgi:palmitoyltransferase
MAMLYWVLVLGGYFIFVRDVLPLVAASESMSEMHLFLHLPAVVATLTSFVAAAASDPGRITKANVESFSRIYPADGILYSREAKDCETCGHVRVPRSKHCRILKCHVARYDHYCPWIVNVVGHYNTRYFHAFLWATSLLCAYESYLTGSVLWHLVQSRGMLDWQYKTSDGSLAPVPRRYILGVLIRDSGLAFPLGIFCSAVAVFTTLFALYHIYLVVTNVTTNETVKWDDVKIMVRRYGEEGEKVPANRYNRGILGNIHEILFPQTATDSPVVKEEKEKEEKPVDAGSKKKGGSKKNR